MDKTGRRIVRSILLGSALVTGLAVNSNEVKAAEQNEVTEGISFENQDEDQKEIDSVEDDVEVIEGDAVAEESYLAEAEEKSNTGELTETIAADLKKASDDVLEQAQDKYNKVDQECSEIEEKTKQEIEEIQNTIPKEIVEDINQIEDNNSKIDTIDKNIEELQSEHEDIINKLEQEKNNIEQDIEEYSELKEASENERINIDNKLSEYEELCREYTDAEVELKTKNDYIKELENAASSYDINPEEYAKETEELKNALNNYVSDKEALNNIINNLVEEIRKQYKAIQNVPSGKFADYQKAYSKLCDDTKSLNDYTIELYRLSENIDNSICYIDDREKYLNEYYRIYSEIASAQVDYDDYYTNVYTPKKNRYSEIEQEYLGLYDRRNYLNEIIDNYIEKITALNEAEKNIEDQIGERNVYYYYEVYNQLIELKNAYSQLIYTNDLRSRAYNGLTRTVEAHTKLFDILENYSEEPTPEDSPEISNAISELSTIEESSNKLYDSEKSMYNETKDYIEYGFMDIETAEQMLKQGYRIIEQMEEQLAKAEDVYENIKDIKGSQDSQKLLEQKIASIKDIQDKLNEQYYEIVKNVILFAVKDIDDGTVVNSTYTSTKTDKDGVKTFYKTTHKWIINKTQNGNARIIINMSQRINNSKQIALNKIFIVDVIDNEIRITEI